MKRGLYLAPFHELADLRLLAELARVAESRGWDGLFLWDRIAYPPSDRAVGGTQRHRFQDGQPSYRADDHSALAEARPEGRTGDGHDRTAGGVRDRTGPGARSVLGPCHNGRARAWAGTNGRLRFGGTTGRRPFGSSSWDNVDGRFGLWSRRSGLAPGSRRAATDRCTDQHDRWRTVTDRWSGRALTPALTSRFLMILPDLYPSDGQAGAGSLDLTRKRTEVQTLPRLPISP